MCVLPTCIFSIQKLKDYSSLGCLILLSQMACYHVCVTHTRRAPLVFATPMLAHLLEANPINFSMSKTSSHILYIFTEIYWISFRLGVVMADVPLPFRFCINAAM